MKNIVKLTNGTSACNLHSMAQDKISKGETVYNLAAGDPNLEIDPFLRMELAVSRFDTENTHYTSQQGSLALRQKISDKPERVLISNGAKQLIYMSLMATCYPGDRVLVIGPCWGSYIEICKLLRLNYILYIYDDSISDEENLNKIYSILKEEPVSAILFNNPSNPTGKVYSIGFVYELQSFALMFDTWLISDEIYSGIIYDGHVFASLKNMENVIYINGFSKKYGIPGWRFGYAIGEENIIQQMAIIQGQMSGPPNTVIQNVIEQSYGHIVPINIQQLKNRRDFIAKDNKLFTEHLPQAGFYFYIPITGSSEDLCKKFLEEYNILLTPGDEYGVPNTIRISFANIDMKDLIKIKPYLSLIS